MAPDNDDAAFGGSAAPLVFVWTRISAPWRLLVASRVKHRHVHVTASGGTCAPRSSSTGRICPAATRSHFSFPPPTELMHSTGSEGRWMLAGDRSARQRASSNRHRGPAAATRCGGLAALGSARSRTACPCAHRLVRTSKEVQGPGRSQAWRSGHDLAAAQPFARSRTAVGNAEVRDGRGGRPPLLALTVAIENMIGI